MWTVEIASVISLFFSLASAQGEFTLACDVLTTQRSDPIISPGVASGHTHVIIGGTAFNRTMGPNTAVDAKNTTCSVAIDKSNYWQPLLYHIGSDGKFEAVNFQGNVCRYPLYETLSKSYAKPLLTISDDQAVYYLQRACDYVAGQTTCPGNFIPKAPPAGLRMLTGNPTLRYVGPFSRSRNLVQTDNLDAEHTTIP
jgi:hypothetical protein